MDFHVQVDLLLVSLHPIYSSQSAVPRRTLQFLLVVYALLNTIFVELYQLQLLLGDCLLKEISRFLIDQHSRSRLMICQLLDDRYKSGSR